MDLQIIVQEKKNAHCNKSLCTYMYTCTYIGYLKKWGKGVRNSKLSSRKYMYISFLLNSK